MSSHFYILILLLLFFIIFTAGLPRVRGLDIEFLELLLKLECLLGHQLLFSFGIHTHATYSSIYEVLISSILLMQLVVLANDLFLLTKPVLVPLSLANVSSFTSSGFLCLSKTHFNQLININNLMLAKVYRKFSSTPVT